MSDVSPRLDLPLIKPSQAQKHVTHNEALQLLDALVQAVLEETGAETPPASPVNGTLFALGAAPTGDWAGEGGKLALRAGEGWLFLTPHEGWRAWDKAEGVLKAYQGGAWAEIAVDFDNLSGIGIGTTSDSTNRLAMASAASLFTHDGAGHQIKVNKADDTETASLLFQSGFTGHAEMGLAGDTAFSLKVSDDGSAWHDALKADAATQEITIPFKLVGTAVQQAATDITPGRLMRADYGYGPGNLLGTVSQSGGTPTGAVIEYASNANGHYIRHADGTQICWRNTLQLSFATAARLEATWTYPASFTVTADVSQSGHVKSTVGSVSAFASTATPSADEITPGCAFNVGGLSNVAVNVFRVSGGTDFVSGDTVEVSVMAVGRWF
ncbi:MAG: DUF2793 domain-containing protein [Roseovarius sp.]